MFLETERDAKFRVRGTAGPAPGRGRKRKLSTAATTFLRVTAARLGGNRHRAVLPKNN